MNTIAIGIAVRINDRKIYACIPNLTWQTKATIKAAARLKLARLKRKVEEVALKVAMAIIPMPQCAAV